LAPISGSHPLPWVELVNRVAGCCGPTRLLPMKRTIPLVGLPRRAAGPGCWWAVLDLAVGLAGGLLVNRWPFVRTGSDTYAAGCARSGVAAEGWPA